MQQTCSKCINTVVRANCFGPNVVAGDDKMLIYCTVTCIFLQGFFYFMCTINYSFFFSFSIRASDLSHPWSLYLSCLLPSERHLFKKKEYLKISKNNNNSYIARHSVKNYKLTALYIVNIKIRLTINNNNNN